MIDAHELAAMALRESIATQALLVGEEARGRKYSYGGKTPAGFDCSGFVHYVLERCLPEARLRYAAAGPFVASAMCERLHGKAQALPGDFVFFGVPAGRDNHIGIVISEDEWIGSQTSTGVARVAFANPYWAAKPIAFYRLAAAALMPKPGPPLRTA